MKREYKMSSVVLVIILGAAVSFITNGLIGMLGKDSDIIKLIASFITTFIAYFFQYALASGLLKNRMGSLGEYLNQINGITSRFIIINIIISLITLLITTAIGALGGGLVYNTIQGGEVNNSKPGMILGLGVLLLVFLILTILVAYTNFYLADDSYEEKTGVFEDIKNIFRIGKDLFGKTVVINLKYMILPLVLFAGAFVLILVAVPNDGMGGIFLTSLLSVIFLVYLFFASAIVLARISDAYLDYREEKLYLE